MRGWLLFSLHVTVAQLPHFFSNHCRDTPPAAHHSRHTQELQKERDLQRRRGRRVEAGGEEVAAAAAAGWLLRPRGGGLDPPAESAVTASTESQ